MAIGRGFKLAQPPHDDSGYLSDESGFYGDEARIQELEYRAGSFDAVEWWQHKTPSLTKIANSGISTKIEKETAKLYNPYEGLSCGRQLGETVDEFLARLPPATTQVTFKTPWIYIANPFRKVPVGKREQDVKQDLGDEGPPDEDSEWAKFLVLGGNLLEELTGIRHTIEKEKTGQARATITRAVNFEKELIVQKILDTATGLNCTSGKWMMFCPPNEVNAVWSVVARATAENDFGIAAKVAPDDGERGERLICIYTKTFNDIGDVTRVIRKMKNLGLVESKKTLYYKCDAYTYLGINSGNEYNIKASLYNSADVLAGKIGKKDQKKLDAFFNKKRDLNGDRRQLKS